MLFIEFQFIEFFLFVLYLLVVVNTAPTGDDIAKMLESEAVSKFIDLLLTCNSTKFLNPKLPSQNVILLLFYLGEYHPNSKRKLGHLRCKK
ncbi:MAG: hypothetical protein OEY49_18685 [Candidatus Heimdallarchaeota archaeon]|nr:hypothetical protein [Candidatus Heimdallarchaeota archaeon]